eukprot:CAMPEP_0114995968 /NCGR_PEP_ID=MMETSP0216-20121206/14038_1 /TAXON_ID=223996 /ORGANISM="Protocruzia adherens, Strain Boccale" /LENGTH=238 /DNA_ID=CAMNT_0002360097 /DNA_START=33 /DNA_END=749 /DNA_ORIENTATION=-
MVNLSAPNTSLVKYDTPILESTSGKKGKDKKKKEQNLDPSNQTIPDVLNSIMPPREYTDDGQLWVQYVSSTPATKNDVINLQEELDRRLQLKQARETGICPIREELYAQCFDELIRQISIICAERGLLLLRVRDEIRMTIQAYQTLYESSIAFGMRKALQSEQKKSEMENKIKELDNECSRLQNEVEELEQNIEDVEKREQDQQEREEKAHKDEVEFWKRSNEKLKKELESLLSAPKK